jgi:hypothetical protein
MLASIKQRLQFVLFLKARCGIDKTPVISYGRFQLFNFPFGIVVQVPVIVNTYYIGHDLSSSVALCIIQRKRRGKVIFTDGQVSDNFSLIKTIPRHLTNHD